MIKQRERVNEGEGERRVNLDWAFVHLRRCMPRFATSLWASLLSQEGNTECRPRTLVTCAVISLAP